MKTYNIKLTPWQTLRITQTPCKQIRILLEDADCRQESAIMDIPREAIPKLYKVFKKIAKRKKK